MADAGLQPLADGLVAAGAPGAVVRLETDAAAVPEAAAGLADISNGRPMERHLRFRAGSLTKSFVGALLASLAADGRLDLDDPLERWLPGILPYADEITLRQLLNHTAGVPNFAPQVWQALYGSPEDRLKFWPPRELVALVADSPPVSEPGSRWSYSNVGYILLGLVVETATERALGDELQRAIFGPLGLEDTTFPADAGLAEPAARGYSSQLGSGSETRAGPLVDVTRQDPSWAWAAGAIISTVADLCRFFAALLQGRLVPEPLRDAMLAMVDVPAAALPLPIFSRSGLGIVGLDTPAGPLIGSPGGILGYLNMVVCTPDGGRRAALMINIGDAPPDPVVAAFVQAIRHLGELLYAG